jgi:hypothetical protein
VEGSCFIWVTTTEYEERVLPLQRGRSEPPRVLLQSFSVCLQTARFVISVCHSEMLVQELPLRGVGCV